MYKRLKLTLIGAALMAALLCTLAAGPALAQTEAKEVPASASAVVSTPRIDAKATTKVDNPYGISALWTQSDVVTKTVLLLLALMSMASWYVIATKLIEQRRMGRQASKAEGEFWTAPSVQAGTEQLASGSPFRFVAQAGLDATQRHVGLRAKVDFNDWIDLSIHRATERVQRKLSNGMTVLATVGSVSPFVGLFGTVWGIYHALTAIGVAGQASIDKVAGPVGEALIMTAIGLAVAVPAVMGYNWLLRRNLDVMNHLRDFSGELHSVLLGNAQAA